MKALVMRLETQKFHTTYDPANKHETSILPTKTAVLGVVGAVVGIQRNTPDMFFLNDFLVSIVPQTPLTYKNDDRVDPPRKVVVNAKAPFKNPVVLDVYLIPTNVYTETAVKKFLKRFKKLNRRGRIEKKIKLYLGQKEYPLKIKKVSTVEVIKSTETVRLQQKYAVPKDGVKIIQFPVDKKQNKPKYVRKMLPVKFVNTVDNSKQCEYAEFFMTTLDEPYIVETSNAYYIPDTGEYLLVY